MNKRKALVCVILICVCFFLCGLILGYQWGGSSIHNKWIEWNGDREDYLDQYCTCIEPQPYKLGGVSIDIDFENLE